MATTTDLNQGLRRLVDKHGVSLQKLAQKLDVSASDCMRWWVHHESNFPISKIRNLTWALGATDDDLLNGRISASTVDTGILDFDDKINPKYLTNAFSYTMSSRHIVEYMNLRYGAYYAKGILYRMGVHPDYFRFISNRISITFFEDLLREFIALGNTIEDIQRLSRFIYLTTEEDQAGARLFRQCHRYAEAWEVVAEATKSFDENFTYDFEVWPNKVRIICKPTELLIEATKNPKYGSPELYAYRSQMFGNAISQCGLPALPMSTVKCVSQGDEASVYETEFNDCIFLSRD